MQQPIGLRLTPRDGDASLEVREFLLANERYERAHAMHTLLVHVCAATGLAGWIVAWRVPCPIEWVPTYGFTAWVLLLLGTVGAWIREGECLRELERLAEGERRFDAFTPPPPGGDLR